MKYWRRLAIVIVGFVESLVFSGCLFGWPSLLHVLQQEGVYSHLCTPLTNESLTTTTTPTFYSTEVFTQIVTSTEDPLLWHSTHSTSDKSTVTVPLDNHSSKRQVSTASSSTEDDQHSVRKKRSPRKEGTDSQEIIQLVKQFPEKPILHRTTCTEQTVQMTLIYTIAAVSYGLTSILIGFSLDILGLWFTRIGGCIMTSGGFFLLAFTTPDKSWLLWPALNLIALGTSQLRLSSFQFANLWPKYRTTVLIFYSSAYSVSTTVFLLIQIAYVSQIPYKMIVIAVATISLLTFPPTLLMPKMKIEDHKEDDKVKVNVAGNVICNRRKVSNSSMTDDITRFVTTDSDDNVPRILKGRREDNKLMNPFDEEDEDTRRKQSLIREQVPLSTSLWTMSAGLHVLWHFITFFLILFYSSTFILWIQMMSDDPKLIEHYNKVSGVCALIAPIFIPIAGLLTDWRIRKASKLEDRIEKLALTMQAPAQTKAIASLFVLGTMICKVFFTPEAVYLSMVLIAISRPFIVGSCASYIRLRFHPSHFNRLNGIFTTIVSILSLTQFPVIVWMKRSENNFVTAQLVLIGILVLAFASPGHIMIKSLARKYAREQLKFRKDI